MHTPESIIKKSIQNGISAISFTDHDTIMGYKNLSPSSTLHGVELISGVELSVAHNNNEIHLLGYFINTECKRLQDFLQNCQYHRYERIKKMVISLRTQRIKINYDEVVHCARNSSSIGRPHIAYILIKKGYVFSFKEAFDKYIGQDCEAYEPSKKLSLSDGIQIINEAGGISVLAHPGKSVSKEMFQICVNMGIQGVEVIHPSHTQNDIKCYTELAYENYLLMTGGSDYHGEKPNDEINFFQMYHKLRMGRKDETLDGCDICDTLNITSVFKKFQPHSVINFAAETHVDKSILHSEPFVLTNVLGVHRLLECSRQFGVKRFIHISTDEVYGSLKNTTEEKFTELTPTNPNSPYSASKAGGDALVRAYFQTYNLDIIITRCSNNYGPFQFPEKLIPFITLHALANQPVPVYGKGTNIRDWIYVDDHCHAIDLVWHYGRAGETYNIGSNCELENIEVVKRILNILDKPYSLITWVNDRLGHDFRYAINSKKICTELNWSPSFNFKTGLEATVQWYKANSHLYNNLIQKTNLIPITVK
ncbi:hypothetical protein CHS0354_024131 [Potamilus streckersoni]|uniref:dTDP-glucose 4,6-dehydratase n=1 Tax=Potamilus streckersoni TaxID=2493646 RepID=A0AAE0RZF0_9BIVA|nr:hypothetical protein CHS0354_024131 [Potamilus streckersoni]